MIDDAYIIEFFKDKNGKINTYKVRKSYLTKHSIEVKDYLENRYDDFMSYTHTVKCIFLSLSELPKCETCGKILINPNATYCSDKCRANGNTYKNNMKELYMYKYGVDNPAKSQEIQDKIKKTNQKRYGVDNVYQASSIKEKCAKTKQSKYGDQYYNNTSKRKQTMNTRYNVDAYSQTSDYIEKRKRKYIYDNYKFDSLLEIVFYIYHRDMGYEIIHEPCQFIYEFNGTKRIYNPDFKINDELYEIKGAHFFEDDKMINPFDRSQDDLYEAKHQCMLVNNVHIVIDCSKYFEYVYDTYGKDYLEQYKVS